MKEDGIGFNYPYSFWIHIYKYISLPNFSAPKQAKIARRGRRGSTYATRTSVCEVNLQKELELPHDGNAQIFLNWPSRKDFDATVKLSSISFRLVGLGNLFFVNFLGKSCIVPIFFLL